MHDCAGVCVCVCACVPVRKRERRGMGMTDSNMRFSNVLMLVFVQEGGRRLSFTNIFLCKRTLILPQHLSSSSPFSHSILAVVRRNAAIPQGHSGLSVCRAEVPHACRHIQTARKEREMEWRRERESFRVHGRNKRREWYHSN